MACAGRRTNNDKYINEKRHRHRRLWWNRRLDRKTTGERWIFGGRELRGKTGPGTSSCRRSQGCRRTGHRCASRCGDCRRRGAAFQRVDGCFRQTRCGGSLCGHHAALSDCQRRRGRLRQGDRDELKVHGEAEALRVANDTEYGLTSAVFTGDIERGARFALRVQAGMTHVNDATFAESLTGPFGGEKNSGLGRFGGEGIISELTRETG